MQQTIINPASLNVNTTVGVITALAGLIAAVAATTQLSYRHRMMRIANWAREQIPTASGKRLRYLEKMSHWAQSEVAAATMIPSTAFVEPLITATLSLSTPILNDVSLQSFGPTAFLLQTIQYRRTVRLYLERRRCAIDYYENRPVHPARIGILFQMEGGTRKEFLWAALIALELTAASLMLASFIHNDNEIMFFFAITLGIAAFGAVVNIRHTHRHPFLAET